MALFKFTRAILKGEPLNVFNNGNMSRDFTYIDDLVNGVRLLIDVIPSKPPLNGNKLDALDNKSGVAPFRIVNIGNSKPEKLTDLIAAVESCTGISAVKNLMPMQAGDVKATWADNTLLEYLTGFRPKTKLIDGVHNFVQWYRDYYKI